MGALPKNKITSAERGKRRHGNRPKLEKDFNVAKVGLHKRSFVMTLMKKIGISL